MNQPIKTLKFSLNFMGLRQTAWATEDGDVVKEEGLMGIKLVKTDKEAALAGLGTSKIADLTESISVASNIDIQNQNEPSMLEMTLYGVNDTFFLKAQLQDTGNGPASELEGADITAGAGNEEGEIEEDDEREIEGPASYRGQCSPLFRPRDGR